MDLAPWFQSVVDQDEQPIVICDTKHTILYMNPMAVRRYERRGGAGLVGQSLLQCHGSASAAVIERVTAWFAESRAHERVLAYRIEAEHSDVYMVALRDGQGALIGYYEQHVSRVRDERPFYAMD